METVPFIGRGNREYRLPLVGGQIVVPRDLIDAEPTLWFATEHRDATLSDEVRVALAGMVVEGPAGPRPLDPSLGGLLVPLAEWRRRAGAPRRRRSMVRVGDGGRDPVWSAKPPGEPWPAPVGGRPGAPGRLSPTAPRARRPAEALGTAAAWVLAALCLAALVGCLQWAIVSWDVLGPARLVNGLLLLTGVALLGRLAQAAGASRPARLAGRLSGASALVLVGSVVVQLLI